MTLTSPNHRGISATNGPTTARTSTWSVTALLVVLLVSTVIGGVGTGQSDSMNAQQGTASLEELEATVQRFYNVFATADAVGVPLHGRAVRSVERPMVDGRCTRCGRAHGAASAAR